MIGQYRKDYREMYRKILEIVKNGVKNSSSERENFVDDIGELVIIEYGLSYKAYKANISNSPASKTISVKTKEILKEISDAVSEYENNLLENELPKSKNIIDLYIKSDALDAKSYCDSVDLDINEFKKAKKIISIYDKDEKALLNKEQEIKDKIRKKFIAEEVETLAYLLENDIELENGEKRKFDLIDYYEVTDVEPNTMYTYISTKRISFGDMILCDISKVKRFLNGIKTNAFLSNPIDTKRKLNDTIKFAEKDENGKIIEGSFRTIDESEKISLIDYLNANRIPLIEGTYEAGIRRIRNNTFGLEEINKSSNKKIVLK